MFNTFKINLNTIGTATTLTLNIPMSLETQNVDQGELVERVFVDVEMQKAVNPIIDYEKVRLTPINSNNQIVNKVVYKLDLFSGTTYGSVGFTYDDIKFKKETFKQTYLELKFYDSDNPMSQNLISFVTLFSKLKVSDLEATGNIGLPKPVNQIALTFDLENDLSNPLGITEGYYLYNYKDELLLNVPKYLYMKANFKNAKTGTITNLMVKNTALPIDELVHELYTRYVLVRNNNGYFYTIDDTYQWNTANAGTPNNVLYTSGLVTVTLFEINAL
jgi:hypothetical protein